MVGVEVVVVGKGGCRETTRRGIESNAGQKYLHFGHGVPK
jgi:hypothetical protein